MNSIEIEGIILTPDIRRKLKQWQNTGIYEGQLPKQYNDYLTDTQDFLTNLMLVDENKTKPVVDLLTKLILIKDDLKCFIINNKGEQEQE